MSLSWRIQSIFDNRSQKSIPSAGGGLGATVIKSTRGSKKPVYFGQGETAKILNIFGVPTADNPELLEAIEYNKSYPMYISSPSNLGKSAAIVFGPSGSLNLGDAINTEVTNDLSNLSLFSKLISISDVSFAGVLGHDDTDILKTVADTTATLDTFNISIDGVDETDIAASDDGETGTYVITGSNISSGSLTLDTGEINITFNTAIAGLTSDSTIVVEYGVDVSTNYGILALKSPCDTDYLKVKINSVTVNNADAFEMFLQIKNTKGVYINKVDSPITFSLDIDHEDGFGQNIYIDNVFDNSDFFIPFTLNGATFSSFTDDTAYALFNKGYRGGEFSSSELTTGYAYFEAIRTYPIDVFFDATQNTDVPAIYQSLRENFHKYSRFILPVPQMDVASALEWTMPVSNRGISFYYGYFYLRNLYGSVKKFVSIPMGEIAKKHADIMLNAFGGLAPAWFDENNMGGQLTSGRILETVYDPSEAQLKLLDEARINPIILDSNIGALIVSRRTSLSGSLSDWSFIDYSGATDYIVKNIAVQVLPYQLVKMNDSNHRSIVRSKTESILQPMTVAPLNVVRDFLVKCDGQNNSDEVFAREEFVLDLAVKLTPKSRRIIFAFINTPQGSEVSAMFE